MSLTGQQFVFRFNTDVDNIMIIRISDNNSTLPQCKPMPHFRLVFASTVVESFEFNTSYGFLIIERYAIPRGAS